MLVYPRDGSAQTVVRTDMLRLKLQIKFAITQSQCTDTGPPIPALTLYRQAPGREATRLPMLDPYEYHMDLCNESCSSSRPAVLHGNIFNVGHFTHTVPPIVIVSVIFKGIIDFYHSVPLSLILTLPGGSQGQRKAKPVAFVLLFLLSLWCDSTRKILTGKAGIKRRSVALEADTLTTKLTRVLDW